jgi:type III secretion protein W
MADNANVSGIGASGSSAAGNIQKTVASEVELEIAVLSSEEALEEGAEGAQFSGFNRETEKLENKMKHRTTSTKEAEEKDDGAPPEAIDKTSRLAKALEEKNSEMNQHGLLGLKAGIKESDDAEAILVKVRRFYKDEYLADEALKFLEETTNPHTNIGRNIRKALILLRDRYGREVRAGRNINETAQAYAKEGLAKAGSLRELYKEVTGNPKDPASLFDELSSAFNFPKMKSVLAFLLHSLGKDMKSKGPSISKQELSRLFAEARTMQAILGIYKFFQSRMGLIKDSFTRENLYFPKNMTFELLAKLFTKYAQERYPSPDKVLRDARELGIDSELIAQIIVFTQYRDAIRGVSPKLFRSVKHRGDLLMALIETISELDDLLEEEEEEEEDEIPPKTGWETKDSIE